MARPRKTSLLSDMLSISMAMPEMPRHPVARRYKAGPMKKILCVFAFTTSTMAAASELPEPVTAFFSHAQSMVLTVGAWTLAGVLLGVILGQVIGKNNRLLGETLFTLSATSGLCAGVVDQGVWGAMEPKTNVSPTTSVQSPIPRHPPR